MKENIDNKCYGVKIYQKQHERKEKQNVLKLSGCHSNNVKRVNRMIVSLIRQTLSD